MDRPVVAVEASVNEKGQNECPVGKEQRLDLSVRSQRRFVLAQPLSEFGSDTKVFIRLRAGIEIRGFTVEKRSSAGVLSQLSEGEYEYRLRVKGKARQGVRYEHLAVRIRGVFYPLKITLPFEAENLNREQYEMMLDDISHWIYFSLGKKVEHTIEKETPRSEDGALQAEIATFKLLQKRIDQFEAVLQRIGNNPKRKIQKKYVESRHPPRRRDSKTMRRNELFADAPHSLVCRPHTTYDVYENRFILFLLGRLDRLLQTLRKSARRTSEDKETARLFTEKRKQAGYRTIEQVEAAREEEKQAKQILKEIDSERQRLQQMKHLPFLRKVNYDPSQFKLTFSLTLTQDINYARVFSLFKEFSKDVKLRRLDQAREFTEGLMSLGVKKTSEIYEYWTFFATYRALRKLGFAPLDSKEGLLTIISRNGLTPGLKANDHVTLGGSGEWEHVRVKLSYEKDFWHNRPPTRNQDPSARPDLTLTIERIDRGYEMLGHFILDAKYNMFGEDQQKAWKRAIEQVKHKYQPPAASSKGKIERSRGAFLMHVNASDGNRKAFNGEAYYNNDPRWYGYIPVLPGNTNSLDLLIDQHLFRGRLREELE